VRYGSALLTVVAAQGAVAALAAVFYLVVRPSLLVEASPAPGGALALALAPWLVPGAATAGVVASLLALTAPLRRSRRMALAAGGLVVSAFAVGFAVLAVLTAAMG
jgi:hypothetical protein